MYFSPPRPRVLAHRGFTQMSREGSAGSIDENTIESFRAALSAGVQYIETDVRSTKDGVAVLVHDAKIKSNSSTEWLVRNLSAYELSQIRLASGGRVPTLFDTLTAFPNARFNIDIKERAAIMPTVSAIRDAQAFHRVLVTSFSRGRRRAVMRELPAAFSGAGQSDVIFVLTIAMLGMTKSIRRVSKEINAIQVPGHPVMKKILTHKHLKRIQTNNIEVHVWTINTEEEMTFWLDRGVDGVVTDHADVGLRVSTTYAPSST